MDKLAQFVADKALEILHTDKDVAAMVLSVDSDGKRVVIPVGEFETQDEKRIAFGIAIGVARALGSPRLLVITDAWFTKVASLDNLDTESPNRAEVLFLTDSTELGVTGYMLKYSRDKDNNITPGKWEDVGDSLDGMMVELLTSFSKAPDPPPKVVAQARIVASMMGVPGMEVIQA